MQDGQLNVVKASGEIVPFDPEKLRYSLERAGAKEDTIEIVYSEILDYLYDGISTKKIYKKAFLLLRKLTKTVAAKYRLKKAIIDLGPTGYAFEKFIGELLKNQGYEVEVGKIVTGHCIQHEVDVVAEKNNRIDMIECKFHSDQARKSDVKTALYVQSRFVDIKTRIDRNKKRFNKGWIITNTRFSDDAYKYGKCVGLKLISWDYPKGSSLKDRIGMSGLHPVTCLVSLRKMEMEEILNMGILLCSQLCQESGVLNKLGISAPRQKRILNEAKEVCQV